MAFKQAMISEPNYTTTANGALAFNGTGSALLDHFSSVVARDQSRKTKWGLVKGSAMSDSKIIELTKSAFAEDQRLARRLLAHLRDCRGGKGERHASKIAWTFFLNTLSPTEQERYMKLIPFYGCYRDLIDWFSGTNLQHVAISVLAQQIEVDRQHLDTAINLAQSSHIRPEIPFTDDIELVQYVIQFLRDKGNEEPNGLTDDEQTLLSDLLTEVGQITLAAKWAPGEKSTYNKSSALISPTLQLATELCGFGQEKLYQTYRVRYLKPLRKITKVVESLMCTNQWEKINFSEVPSKALKQYSSKAFPTHQAERFAKWLVNVRQGKVKINSSQVDPYEIVHDFLYGEVNYSQEQIYQAFFDNQVADFVKSFGELTNRVVMADVSGSMLGTPMSVSIALALWISAMASKEWRNLFLTFSSTPTFVTYDDAYSLRERVQIARTSDWGYTTNLQAALNAMLDRAVEGRLKATQMPKQLIVVSDMQFDIACGTNALTNLQQMKKTYSETKDPGGNPYPMPVVVFWNVSGKFDGSTAPASANDNGVIMLSGFSKDLIKVLLENQPFPTPYEVMVKTLSDKRYDLMD